VGEIQRRVHPDLCIYYGGKVFWVGVPDLCGEMVDAFVNIDGKLWIHHRLVGYLGPLEEGVKANVMGVDFKRPELTYWERNLKEVKEIAENQGINPPGQYYSRESDKVFRVPEINKDATPGEMTVLDAKVKISKEIGVPMSELPQSTREVIDEILESNKIETYEGEIQTGLVPGEIVEEIILRIKEVVK